MNKLLELSPLIFDETDDIHQTDYPGTWVDLYRPKHLFCVKSESTTLSVEKN